MELKLITQALADGIVDSAKKDWDSAALQIEFFGAAVDTKLKFDYIDKTPGGEFLEGDQIANLLRKYHEFVHQHENAKWNRMFFTLQSNGKFEIEFKWDQQIQDDYERDSQM